MRKLTNKFTTAILLFWLSMCIWKICSLTGQANILCMVTVSLLDIMGVSMIISNLYQLEDWNFGEWWLYRSSRLIVTGLMMWIAVLCGLIGSAASLSFYDGSFNNASMVSYVALQVCYLLNGILTMVISIFYVIVLIKTSAKHGNIRIIQYIQQQKWFCSSYAAGVILCRLISAVLLNTGEHKSTPVSNMILNLLYFCMLIYLLICLCVYWKKTQKLLSPTVSDADISEETGWKPYGLKLVLTWGFALMCTVISGYGAIANYSAEMDFEYREFQREGGIVLKKYTGQRPYVEIPKQINGQQVIGLENSFYGCDFIKSVSLPDSIKTINEDAFGSCKKLKKIMIPDSVEEIGDYAFRGCKGLVKVELPSNLKVIRQGTFARCNSLKQIMIPDGVSIIEEKAFADCSGLRQVVLPEGIKKIGQKAFLRCLALEEIEFSEGLTVIQEEAFYGCSGLSHVALPQSLKWLDEDAFAMCINLKTIQIPQDIDYIASDAFKDCKNLESTIPKTSFVDREEVIVPDGVTVIREDTFRNCNKLKYVHLPEGLRHIGEGAFAGCTSLEEIVIPESVREIESKTFSECHELKSIEMLGVREIKTDSFEGCVKLRNIVISDKASFTVQDIIGQIPAVAALFAEPLRINGEEYQFPMTYEAFTALGWQNDYSADEIVKAKDFIGGYFTMGENKCQALIENYGWWDIPAQSCSITGIQLLSSQCKDMDVRLPEGFEVMQCSQETVELAYGPPNDGSYKTGKTDCILYYDDVAKMSADFCFFSDSKKLKLFRIGVDIRLPQVDCLDED